MSSKYIFLYRFTVIAALLLLVFSFSASAQNLRSEGFGTAPASKSETGKNSDFNRQRLVKNENGSQISKIEFSTAQFLDLERRTLTLINQKRAEMNLPALEWSDEVAAVARAHSENMVKFDFFSHAGKDGTMVDDRAALFGINKWQAIGENIAYNRGFQSPVETAVERWMLSPPHKENLLGNRWTETGIGIAAKADGTFYFTQVFLKR